MVRTGEVLESMLAEVARLEAVVEKSAGRFGHEYLAAVTGRHHPRTLMDGEADVPAADRRRLSGVQADPHADLAVVRPVVPGQRLLRRDRCRCGVLSRGEGDEEGVALSVDLDAVVARERRAQNASVFVEEARVCVASSLQ